MGWKNKKGNNDKKENGLVNGNKSNHQGKFYSGKINFTIDNYVWIRDPIPQSDLPMKIRKPSMANFSYIKYGIAFSDSCHPLWKPTRPVFRMWRRKY